MEIIMTIKGIQPRIAEIAADGTVPFTPEQIVEQLRILRQHIPNFGPLAVTDAALLRRAAHVHDDMLRAATNTVGASPFVSGALGKDAEALRNERTDVSRWSAVEDELQAMYKGVTASNLTRRHQLGLTALQAYFITQQLVRQREHADLLPHVAEMRRANMFGTKRRPQPAEPPVVPTPDSAKP
jgi:predicted XRE-type DNA-binding protein